MLKPDFLKSIFLRFGFLLPGTSLSSGVLRFLSVRALVAPLLLLPLLANAQSFTMTVTQPYPAAVDAGQDSRAYINLGTVNGFTGSVALSCSVTPAVQNGPVCSPPATATPPQQAAMSITVISSSPAGFYTLTVTGTAGAQTITVPLSLTVISVIPSYTLAVTTSITPPSVTAGYPANATITASPVNGYSGTVTLSCSSITPVATPAPSCAFNPPAVTVPGTSFLTITTTGNTAPPPPSGAASLPTISGGGRGPSSKLLSSPLWSSTFFTLRVIAVFFSFTGRRRRKLYGLSLLLLIAACFLLMPGCAPPNNSNTGLNGSTPKNTYIFTLTGADINGVAPSNEATPPTVTLIVD